MEETDETSIDGLVDEGRLVCLEEISPVATRLGVVLHVNVLAQSLRNLRYREVVVAIFQRPRYAPCHGPEALVIKVLDGHVAEPVPAIDTAPTVATPVVRLHCCVLDHGVEARLPVYSVCEAFQEASNLDCIVFDKTGTLTEGTEPRIVRHHNEDGSHFGEETILGLLKAVEENSGHPLARAAVRYTGSREYAAVTCLAVDEIAGKGMKASLKMVSHPDSELEAVVGNESLMLDYGIEITNALRNLLEGWKDSSYSVILVATRVVKPNTENRILSAAFAAADALRPESASVVASLQARQVDVWMLSGDNEKTAIAIGKQVGIPSTNVIAGVLPTQKAEKIKYLQQSLVKTRGGLLSRLSSQRNRATVAMVGDGINDAPALAAADVGIAVASGSDVAVQSAAFVLVHSDLRAVLTLVTLSRAVFSRVILNFFWAAVYNMIALPIAAGVLYPIKSGGSHVRLDPAWAALAMALSSISVVGSSLLLRTRIPIVGFRQR